MVKLTQEVLSELELEAEVLEAPVKTPADAETQRFAGSLRRCWLPQLLPGSRRSDEPPA